MNTNTTPSAQNWVPVKGYVWQEETLAAYSHLIELCPGTIAAHDAKIGMAHHEPMIVMMDSAIRLTKAYRSRYDSTMGADYMARDEIAGILSGVRGLLNFNGGLSMEGGLRCNDSKDNGMIESLYWTACEIAGIDGESI
jgi:hypothetical protein